MSEMGESGQAEEPREAQGEEEVDGATRLRSPRERNGGVQPSAPEKEKKLGMLKSFRESIKRTAERSPLSKDHLNTEMGKQNIDPEITSPTQSQPPPSPMMQINKLIEMEVLEEAHLNLLSLRLEVQQEQCSAQASPLELAKKEKDLSLLYGAMQDKVKSIVRNSNSLPSRNKELLVDVARIIQEEEKREGDPGAVMGPGGCERGSAGQAGKRPPEWKGRECLLAGCPPGVAGQNHSGGPGGCEEGPAGLVPTQLQGVQYLRELLPHRCGPTPEEAPAARDRSEGLLRSAGLDRPSLREVKPPDQSAAKECQMNVEIIDVLCCVLPSASEKIMGNPSLRPEMEEESTALYLEEDFLETLQSKYCRRVQEDMKDSLDRIVTLEDQDMWKKGMSPESDDDNFLCSDIHMDIWTKVQSNAVNSKKIDVHLEKIVLCACFEELQQFPKRFEFQFEPVLSSLRGNVLGVDYQITYINTFLALKEHMVNYRDICPTQADLFSSEADGLVQRLLLGMENQFKNETKVFLRRMMTRKWLTSDQDFQELYTRTEKLFQQCAKMRSPYVQMLVSNLHYHLVKEYVSQLMKNNYSCKHRKHERAAKKIREQWSKLRELFQDMKTDHEWLHPLGDYMCDIIGQKNKRDIKNHLQPLVKDYPDISKSHLAAVLYFRGVRRGGEKWAILQRFSELTKAQDRTGRQSRSLFTHIEVPVNTDCLADLPFSCLSVFLPNS